MFVPKFESLSVKHEDKASSYQQVTEISSSGLTMCGLKMDDLLKGIMF